MMLSSQLARRCVRQSSKLRFDRMKDLRWVSSSSSHSSYSVPGLFPPKENDNDTIEAKAKNKTNQRIVKALYKQLIRWCHTVEQHDKDGNNSSGMDTDIPIYNFVPPLNFQAPEQIDPFRMELLAHGSDHLDDDEVTRARRLLPAKTEFQSTHMTVPIHTVSDLKQFFQAIFRLNNILPEDPDNDYQKTRISATFEALKSLNELLSGRLDSLRERRRKHQHRPDFVQFRVGQVVKHKHEKWRGVIFDWDADASNNESSSSSKVLSDDFGKLKTSLTTKEYTIEDNVRYNVILDAGDAYSMGSITGWSIAMQPDLELLQDTDLCRVRSSMTEDYFSRYDPNNNVFIPNQTKTYEYPADVDPENHDKNYDGNIAVSPETTQICNDVMEGVRELAELLQRVILDETSCPKERGMEMLHDVHTRLQNLIAGDVFPNRYKYLPGELSIVTTTSFHLRELLNISLEVFSIMHHRRLSMEHKHKIQYQIGDVVQHKLYNFRGVVVAWDPKPRVDVSRWDGLQHIEDPKKHPFYHVIPDQSDCREAFGGERPLRYVCEENLERCPSDKLLSVNVDLDPDWKHNPEEGTYHAPQETRFKYGDDMEDDGATERCMKRIASILNSWQCKARETETKEDSVATKLNMKNIMHLLKVADNLDDATTLQDLVKEIRKAHAREDVRWRLDTGVVELIDQNVEKALDIFKNVVEQDQNYVEGWNKRATCEFMLRQITKSFASTNRVLELDPNHFQALNGLGLLYFEEGEYDKAADCFRKSMDIDPWSPVSSKLAICCDLLNRRKEKDD